MLPYLLADVVSAIAAVNFEFVAAFGAKESQRLSMVYTSDGKAMPAGAPVQDGRSAIAALFQGVMDSGLARVALATKELLAGDRSAQPSMVVERGVYTFYDAGNAVKDVGKYIVVWALEGSQYKYSLDMFSSDGPLAK